MSFSKQTREAIYKKYNGRCAYCGREIAIKDMQIDHLVPQRTYREGHINGDMNQEENLMPACRLCNHYKRANRLETFRSYIADIPRKLRQNYIYKVGIAYGNVVENEKPIRFYFETVGEEQKL